MEDIEIMQCFTFRQSIKRMPIQPQFDRRARKQWLLASSPSDHLVHGHAVSQIEDFVGFVKPRQMLEDVSVCGSLTSFKPVFFIGHRCYQLVYRLGERSFIFRFEDSDKYVLVKNYWLDESAADFVVII